MSAESATALYERVSSDEEFRTQLQAAATPDEKRRIVTEAGYDVSRDDLSTVRKLAGVTELSDADLEKVAGGSISPGLAIEAGPAILVGAMTGAMLV